MNPALERITPGITAMIRVDHSHVLALLRRYKPDISSNRRKALAANSCLALEIHAQLEEEIFYPALRPFMADDPVMLKFDANGGIVAVPVPPGEGVILTEQRAKALATQVQQVITVFDHGLPLDVEWVLEGEKVWIVQARPYVGA